MRLVRLETIEMLNSEEREVNWRWWGGRNRRDDGCWLVKRHLECIDRGEYVDDETSIEEELKEFWKWK